MVANYFLPLVYEGALALCIIVFYFLLEPKLKHEKGFFTLRNIAVICTAVPFAEFLIGFLLQKKDCLGRPLCYGIPDIFSHSIYYDVFFLRTNDQVNGAHWIDYMLLPVLFFMCWQVFKQDVFFSALYSGVMVFFHESIWLIPYYIRYGYAFNQAEFISDFSFIILISGIGFVGIKKYAKKFNKVVFFFGSEAYVLFLLCWYALDDFHITVINNTTIGNINNFLATKWYLNLLTNEFEVFSWFLVFGIFMVNIYVSSRTKNKENILQTAQA